MFAAAFASCLPKSGGWPLPTGLGGVTGDALLKVPAYLLGPMSGWNRIGLAGATGIAALVLIAGALGFGFGSRRSLAETIHREAEEFEQDEERTSISLGWLVHTFLSLKARLWLFITPPRGQRAARTAAARARAIASSPA